MNFLCSKVSCDFLGIIKKEITIEMLQNILLNISKGIHLALAEKVREKIQECSQIKGKFKNYFTWNFERTFFKLALSRFIDRIP